MADLTGGTRTASTETKETGGSGDANTNTPGSTEVNTSESKTNVTDPTVRERDKAEDDLDYQGEPKTVDMDFVYATHLDPQRQNDATGIYLDDVQRENAEIQRAKVEDREPDLKNPPATCGSVVMPLHVAKKQFPGDYVVEADFTAPVVVGVNDEQVDSSAAAQGHRKADAEAASANEAPSGETGADIAHRERASAGA